ncbi:MurR/RpiR family transcriptional regulator [Allofournierella massiliensis]|uniref:MurR/RpiR family transcriptional regulator n=1 Tax=Allofournierella massiliensis TaxID=1650663 RepID=UPI0023EF79F9|nr:MurR/RpiR family transcriptional regulator [Fournierella massiliensis]
MKNVIVRFREYEPHASSAERGIVQLVLKAPEKILEYNSHQLAEAAFSSPATVVRLCKKIGFSGYKAMQQALIRDLSAKQKKEEQIQADIQRDDSLEQIIAKVTYKNIDSLETTGKLLDEATICQCVDLLEDCTNIALFGLGSSLLVARDACQKFLRVNKTCLVADDWHMQLLYAKNLTEQDVAIAISYSGMTKEILECANEAKRKGTPLIAITRFADSSLVRLADYNLYVAASEVLVRSGAMSSRISQLNVVDILYTAYINRHFDEHVLQAQKTYMQKENERKEGDV